MAPASHVAVPKGSEPAPTQEAEEDWPDPYLHHEGYASGNIAGPARPLVTQGAEALAAGQTDLAAELFYQAFQADPSHLGALRGLAEAHVLAGRWARALPVYEMILHLDEADEISRFNQAVVLSRLDRMDEAEDAYRRILDDQPRAVRARYNLAVICQSRGRLSEARRHWQQVTADSPQLGSAWSALGEVESDLGNRQAAMLAFAEAAKCREDDVDAWLNLAASAAAAGSLGRQTAALEKAAQLAPHEADIWARLGAAQLQLHRESGRRDLLAVAVESWKQCTKLDPTREDIRDWIETYQPLVEVETQPTTP